MDVNQHSTQRFCSPSLAPVLAAPKSLPFHRVFSSIRWVLMFQGERIPTLLNSNRLVVLDQNFLVALTFKIFFLSHFTSVGLNIFAQGSDGEVVGVLSSFNALGQHRKLSRSRLYRQTVRL
jgi:hypothetical protein